MENMASNVKIASGAKFNKEKGCVEFRLYSKNASKVLLCIFDKPLGENPIMVLNMEKKEDNTFYTSVKNYILNCEKRPVYYGFRVFGANWEYRENYKAGSDTGFISKFDNKGNRFNPNKIAYDPYSNELSHLPSDISTNLSAFRSGSNYYLIDNAKTAIKSVFYYKDNKIIKEAPIRPFSSEIIGEVHIKDLTQKINMPENGTYKGAEKFAKTLKNLGITMIEFLPLNEFDSKQNGVNYWGYMPLGYFTLARKYAYDKTAGNLLNEFRSMVDEFHKNDIKVCLDMVYNHTGEGGLINRNPEDAVLLSYKLIDNSTYYKVYDNGFYRSNSGCGNDFNANSEAVLNLIVESLIYWTNQGVDAFRFDLAAALLENSCNCEEIYDSINSCAAKLKDKLKEKNINVIDDFSSREKGIVLIAEPWTCGGKNCYQLGKFPSCWAEWNDIARDTIRKITLRPDSIAPKEIKELIEGTPSKFSGVNKSINYISCHDGFTLFDLNRYNKKSPSTTGGSDWEICGNYDNNLYKQENAIRKQLALLFFSYGIPMIQIGDIIMHTKYGNNNSYDKDDETNYLNWDKISQKESFENRIMEYIRSLIKFRKQNPIFSDKNFKNYLSYHYDNGKIAKSDNTGYWDNPQDAFFGVLIKANNRIYIALSKSNERLNIILPDNLENKNWYVLSDTTNFKNINLQKGASIEKDYIINSHGLAIFQEYDNG